MRALILAISVLAIGGANAANAGPSTAIRDLSASAEPVRVSTIQATEQPSAADETTAPLVRQARHRGGAHHHRIGGPVGVVGDMVAGLFGRR